MKAVPVYAEIREELKVKMWHAQIAVGDTLHPSQPAPPACDEDEDDADDAHRVHEHEAGVRCCGPGQRALASLGPLSEERLEELLIAAMEVRDKKILRALEELKHIDLEAAHLLNQVLVEVRELRSSGPIIDPDTARALADAGRSLRHIDADLPNQLQNVSRGGGSTSSTAAVVVRL